MSNKLHIIKYNPKYFSILKAFTKEFQTTEKKFYADRDTSEKKILELTKQLNSKEDKGTLFLGLVNEELIGYVHASVQEDKDNKSPCYYVNDLFITKEYQANGYGTELLKYIHTYAKSKGYKYLGIGVLYNNLKALKLYKKIGFKDYGIELIKKI